VQCLLPLLGVLQLLVQRPCQTLLCNCTLLLLACSERMCIRQLRRGRSHVLLQLASLLGCLYLVVQPRQRAPQCCSVCSAPRLRRRV
jgi:hypothetical protein